MKFDPHVRLAAPCPVYPSKFLLQSTRGLGLHHNSPMLTPLSPSHDLKPPACDDVIMKNLPPVSTTPKVGPFKGEPVAGYRGAGLDWGLDLLLKIQSSRIQKQHHHSVHVLSSHLSQRTQPQMSSQG